MGEAIFRRQYSSYDAYLNHQRGKFKVMQPLLERLYDKRKRYFLEQFEPTFVAHSGQSILCMGARDGVEVDALRTIGLLAVGIDLEFSRDNEFVHKGDFHNIPYPKGCFDLAYTNCFDHVFDPDRIFAEVRRILKSLTGRFVVDIPKQGNFGGYESFGWRHKKDIEKLKTFGWDVVDRTLRPDECYWRYTLVPVSGNGTDTTTNQ